VIAGLLVGFAMALGAPKFALSFMRKRRLKQFTLQFADSLDIITRGIQSGLPVGECLAIIGRESPEPIAAVFTEIVENVKLGLNLEDCLNRALERMPSQELRFFSIVLQIQQTTGGNLAETLSNLSRVLRERKKMRDKVKAMAAEANTSAMIIGSLPFLITLALTLVNPSYIAILFEDTTGHILIGIGLTWMTIGVIVMRSMINFDI
jgi:tight adherence protein B